MTMDRDELEAYLVGWAAELFGEQRARELAPSLAERADHLARLSRSNLAHGEEPSTVFQPEPTQPGAAG